MGNFYNDDTWRSLWSKEFDLPKQVEYHLSTRHAFYGLLNKSILSLGCSNDIRVLEVGCGTAIDSCILANMNKARIFCLDLFYPAIKLAKKIATELNVHLAFLNCDAQRVCFKDKSFDLIFSQGVLEHFHDVSLMMEEQVRLLKDYGILIIDVPQTYTLYTIFKKKKVKNGTWPYGWETQFSYGDLIRLGRKYSLEAIGVCGHEYDSHVRFFNFALFRNIIKRLQKKNPWREFILFKKIDSAYDAIWDLLEKKWGHYFLVNIAVAFKKKKVALKVN